MLGSVSNDRFGRRSAPRRGPRRQGSSRRLRLESMEGRLMLSTTLVEGEPLGFQPAEISLAITPNSLYASESISDATISEGGFIAMWHLFNTGQGDLVSPDAWFGQSNLADAFTSNIGYTMSGFSVGIDHDAAYGHGTAVAGRLSDGAIGRSDLTANIRGLDATFETFYTQVIDAGNIQPVVFNRWTNVGDLYLVIQPKLAEQPNDVVDAEQGGLIPIERILARGDAIGDRGDNSAATAVVTIPEKTAIESSPPLRLAVGTPPVNEISGEWARAAVVETAGGEPATPSRTSTGGVQGVNDVPDGAAGPQTGRRVSAIQSPATLQQSRFVAGSAEGASTTRSAPVTFAAFMSEIGSDKSLLNASGRSNSSFIGATRTAMSELATTARALAESPAAELAHASAFEELGSRKAALLAAQKGDNSWHGFRIATPLLMLLALERVAANKARRSKDSAAANSSPPRFAGPMSLSDRD
ncbi:MAG: hypothetical protein WD669_13600 [Pirellulales bacterium]